MNVFEIVPADFFSVLVSPNRELYVEALMKLYEMFNAEINIRLKDYLSEIELLLENKRYIIEEDDDVPESELSSLRGKARIIENRLEKTRWVEREYLDGSFTEIITPLPYAIAVMRMLYGLTQDGTAEYNSLVFSTYSALNQAFTDNRDSMYEALTIAKKNTEKLDYELRTFYHGIRGYLRVIRENSDVNLLLKNHFEAYKKDADRVYHPIKTMDSFFRYAGPIRNILTDIHYNDGLVGRIVQKAMAAKTYSGEDDAREDVLSTIEKILDSYRSIEQLLDEIDAKHSSLTKQSIDKIRYVMSSDRSIKGKLLDLLKAYAGSDGERKERIAEMFVDNIDVNRQEFMDQGSFWHKNIRSRRTNQPPLPLDEVHIVEHEMLASVSERLKNSYSETRVKQYMLGLFSEGKDTVSSDEITVNDDKDYVLILLSVVSAYKSRQEFSVELTTGSVIKNGYRIPRFVLKKRR